jgi:non-specific serine/threonine protein kinase
MERALRRLRKFRGTGEVNDACLAWCEAYAAIMEGRPDAALSLLREVAGAPMPLLEVARVYFEIGKITARPEDFAQALERFKSIDCNYMIERVHATAKSMGVTFGQPRPAPNGTTLTDRQRTIALMISSGKTNTEIANALKISKRTADHHVDHIRDKLGVRSRVEIAVAVANGAAFD